MPLLAVASMAVSAQADSVTVVLAVASDVHVGDHFEATVDVRAPRGDGPVLVTPSEEGDAVTVVRGRMLRADAEDPRAKTLHFRIPIVATERGTAVIRVRVNTFDCAARCKPVTEEARALVNVLEK